MRFLVLSFLFLSSCAIAQEYICDDQPVADQASSRIPSLVVQGVTCEDSKMTSPVYVIGILVVNKIKEKFHALVSWIRSLFVNVKPVVEYWETFDGVLLPPPRRL